MNLILFYSTFQKNISNEFELKNTFQPVLYLEELEDTFSLIRTTLSNVYDVADWLYDYYEIDIDPEYIELENHKNLSVFKIELNAVTEKQVLQHFKAFSYHPSNYKGVKKLLKDDLIHSDSVSPIFDMEIRDFYKFASFDDTLDFYKEKAHLSVVDYNKVQITFNEIENVMISFVLIDKNSFKILINLAANSKYYQLDKELIKENTLKNLNIIKEGLMSSDLYHDAIFNYISEQLMAFNLNPDLSTNRYSHSKIINPNTINLSDFIFEITKRYFYYDINSYWMNHIELITYLYINEIDSFKNKMQEMKECFSMSNPDELKELFYLNYKV